MTVLGFATTHVTGLTVLVVLGLHSSSSLGESLAPVGTMTGFLLFGILWIVTVITHHYGFETVDLWSIEDRRTAIKFIGAGFLWGALTGIGTFWVLVIVAVLSNLLSDPTSLIDFISVPTILIALLGTGVSLLLGGVVGIIAASFDIGVISAIKRFVG